MSVLSEKVRTAIYTALNVSAVVGAGKATAVYHQIADENAVFPYVIFARLAQRQIERVFTLASIHEDDVWLIKCLADESVNYPQTLNETILALCATAIGGTLTLTGGAATHAVYILNDIPPYSEYAKDGTIFHNGFQIRVVAK